MTDKMSDKEKTPEIDDLLDDELKEKDLDRVSGGIGETEKNHNTVA
ncbi:MAG: hypothetical protein ABSB94_15175 [Syntrophorhabdales bacterium]|jgi:hypothetical protein